MSDSVQHHRWQPTRLLHPWDSPGKNTGVGHHFLLQCIKVKSESEVAQSCWTLRDPMDCSLPGSSARGIFQASTGVGCHCLLNLYNSRTFSSPKGNPVPINSHSTFPSFSRPWKQLSIALDLLILDIIYKLHHITCDHLCLPSYT